MTNTYPTPKPDNLADAQSNQLGDMPAEEFRRLGKQLIDWVADYLTHSERYPVLSQAAPGDIITALPTAAPAVGQSFEDIFADLESIVVPGVTHWNHPCFFGYFSISGSGPGILGELLAAAFNVNAMMWRTSPSATELYKVPNPCTTCHRDQTTASATATILKWPEVSPWRVTQ